MLAGTHTIRYSLLAALVALLLGCENFELLSALKSDPLSVSPQSALMPAGSALTFQASGGVPPYTFIAAEGSGVIDGAGYYVAAPAPESARVEVIDATGEAVEAQVTVTGSAGVLSLIPNSITLTVNSNVTFAATGGTPPYVYSITGSGSGSPTIDPNTGFFQTGASPGTDTVQVTDADASTAGATVTVNNLSSTVDYTIPVTNFPAGGTANTAIPGGFDFTIQNSGTGDGGQTVEWQVYVSANLVLDAGDVVISSGTTAALVSGASVVIPLTGTWPDMTGAYNLIAAAGASDDITTGNNVSGAGAVTISPPDVNYTVTAVNNTGATTAGGTLSGDFTAQNVGADAGAQTVYWAAYVSADAVHDPGDRTIDTGSFAALGAGASTAVIGFTGWWSSTPASYYLIVKVAADDDVSAANDELASAAVPVTAPAIDYTVSVVNNTGGTETDSPLSGNFTVQNSGTDAGVQPVSWTAYHSTDAIIDGGDEVIDTGSTGAIGGGGSTAGIPFSGTWPSLPGTYFLLVDVSASDDVNTGNDAGASAGVGVTAPVNVPDYTVSTANISATGTPGALFSASAAHDFTIQETAANAGLQPIDWAVYVSLDQVLDGGDTRADFGTVAALAASGSTVVPFDGTWPANGCFCYLIVNLSADDDSDPINDTFVSTGISVAFTYAEGAENNGDFGPFAGPPVNVSDYGITVPLDGMVEITGTMDLYGEYDTFRLTAGAGVNSFEIVATWATGFDEIDLEFYDESSNQDLSAMIAMDREPSVGPWIPLMTITPGLDYYLSVWFYLEADTSGSTGLPYTLQIIGRP